MVTIIRWSRFWLFGHQNAQYRKVTNFNKSKLTLSCQHHDVNNMTVTINSLLFLKLVPNKLIKFMIDFAMVKNGPISCHNRGTKSQSIDWW